jgi:hypothetical protein
MSHASSTLWQRLRYTRLRDAFRGRFDGSLDWQRLVGDAGLPTDVAETVESVVRRTRLWPREKVDVAKELVAHFQDGLEAGHTPRQLVESFGDPRQVARLIRRAKRRGRSLAWLVSHYVCWAVVTLVLTYLLIGLFMLTQRPAITTDYLAIVNEAALAVPVPERAWPLYRDALLALDPIKTTGEDDAANENPNSTAVPGDAEWPQMERMLRQHPDAVLQLRTAASRAGLGFVPDTSFAAFTPADRQLFGVTVTAEERAKAAEETLEDRWLVSTLLPNVQQLRSAALVLAADARRAAIDGDGKAALADVEAMLGVSRHCRESPFLVCLLVADRVQVFAFDVVRDVLSQQPELWSEANLRDVAHSIAAAKIDWHRGTEGERASIYDAMQRLYTDDGDGDGRITSEGLRRIPFLISMLEPVWEVQQLGTKPQLSAIAVAAVAPAGLLGMASRAEIVAVYDRYMDRQEATLDQPLWEMEPDPLETGVDDWSTYQKLRFLPLTILLPSISPVRNAVERNRGARDGVLLGIALELYHREHGTWPNSLDELAPRWLPEVPVDRITGGPLLYKISDDRPLVYSVGVDRDDDGGRVPARVDELPNSDMASPDHFQIQPVTDPIFDGDWVIWSAVEIK